MFYNLSAGSVIYVLNTKDGLKVSTGQINNITAPRAKSATFNPMDVYNKEYVVDIVATIDGEKREFKQVPSNTSIANFGEDAFSLADSREAAIAQVNTIIQNSTSVVESYDKHKKLIEDGKQELLKLNTSLAAEAQRDETINNLQKKVDLLTDQLTKLVSALDVKPKTN